MDVWVDGRIDRCMDACIAWLDGQRDGCMDGWMDACMHGWIDGWMSWQAQRLAGWLLGVHEMSGQKLYF